MTALAVDASGSFFSGIVGTLAVALLASPLSSVALAFDPCENSALLVFDLVSRLILVRVRRHHPRARSRRHEPPHPAGIAMAIQLLAVPQRVGVGDRLADGERGLVQVQPAAKQQRQQVGRALRRVCAGL